MIVKSENIQKELFDLKLNGYQRGVEMCWDIDYSFKFGFYTHICADPHQGKTEFTFSLSMYLSKNHKVMIFSPETGNAEDIYYELIYKYTGKPMDKLTQSEFEAAKYYIDERFSIVETKQRFTIWQLLAEYKGEQFILIDGLTNLKHNKEGRRDDEYLDDFYQDIAIWLKKNKGVHIIFTIHPRDRETERDGNIRYLPAPKGRDARMGQANYRNAYGWINLWRPKKGLKDEYGELYKDNTTQVHVEKAKPKGVGQFDKTYDLIFSDILRDFDSDQYNLVKKEQNTLQTQIKGIEGNNTDEYVPF